MKTRMAGMPLTAEQQSILNKAHREMIARVELENGKPVTDAESERHYQVLKSMVVYFADQLDFSEVTE